MWQINKVNSFLPYESYPKKIYIQELVREMYCQETLENVECKDVYRIVKICKYGFLVV